MGKVIGYTLSNETNVQPTENIDNINIFCQFFLHPVRARQVEFVKCLKFNVENADITKIYLLNERIYTDEELEVKSVKIVQVDIKERLKFKHVFEYILEENIVGYNVIINSDIFFDKTIRNLFRSDIHLSKKMYTLIRYEFDEKNPEQSPIFGNRGDSQDTWIIHSNFNVKKQECKIFNFEFGKPGCDNKMTYLLAMLGFELLNDPRFIKSYHIHLSNIRGYNSNDAVAEPYEIVLPKYMIDIVENKWAYEEKHHYKSSNTILHDYIQRKVERNEPFLVPRAAGIENDYAIYSHVLKNNLDPNPERIARYLLTQGSEKIKNNAGIKLSSMRSVEKYSALYLKAFEDCELYAAWAPFDNVYSNTHDYLVRHLYPKKQTMYAIAFDIFHNIFNTPWTLALKGKRILIVSTFKHSIDEKIATRKELYGIDLFPDCEIITIRPPQTQGDEPSEEFDVELMKFTRQLDRIKDSYDIALVSCGGYGNLVCSHIFNAGKSAIYVGGVLQMYWGILGQRWFNDRPEIIKLFLNKSWTRPKDTEKPQNYKSIENACYW